MKYTEADLKVAQNIIIDNLAGKMCTFKSLQDMDNSHSIVAQLIRDHLEREVAPLVEALEEIRDLQDQASSTLRDSQITSADRKRYLANNQFETDRVAANALAAYNKTKGE